MEKSDMFNAIRFSNVELLHQAIQNGANVNAPRSGNTPLAYACGYNDLKIIRLLLNYGADVNGRGKNGCTPLENACYKGSEDIVRLLIEHGADPNARDDNGAAPMDMILTNELANEYFAKAVKKAIARTHAAGRPSFHGDGFGLFYLYPDGHKEYISEAEADEILKGRDRYNTDPETLLKKRSDDVSKH